MTYLQGIGLAFDEQMSGWIGEGKTDFEEGRVAGQKAGTEITFDLTAVRLTLGSGRYVTDNT